MFILLFLKYCFLNIDPKIGRYEKGRRHQGAKGDTEEYNCVRNLAVTGAGGRDETLCLLETETEVARETASSEKQVRGN